MQFSTPLTTLLSLVPVISYGWLVFTYATPYPYWDDFDTVIRFLVQWFEGAGTRVELLTAQHNEHRIVLPRALLLAQLFMFGEVDLRLQILFGNTLLVLAVGVLAYLAAERWRERLLLTVPISFLLLSPQNDESTIWFTGVASNVLVLFTALLSSILVWRQHRLAVGVGVVVAVLTTLVQANGLFIFPALLLVLLIQRRWQLASLVFVVGGAIWLWYFRSYVSIPGHCSVSASLAQPQVAALYVVNFLGGAVALSQPGWAILGGAVLIALLMVAVQQGLLFRSPALSTFLLFLLATAAANALGRACFGSEYPLEQGRYRIYGLIFAAAVVAALSVSLRSWRGRLAVVTAAALGAIAVWGGSMVRAHPKIASFSGQLAQGYAQGMVQQGVGLAFPVPELAYQYLQQADARAIFPAESLLRQLVSPTVELEPFRDRAAMRYGISTELQSAQFAFVHGWGFRRAAPASLEKVWLVLRGPQGERSVFQAQVRHRGDVNRAFTLDPQARLGFFALLDRSSLPEGSYQVALAIQDERGRSYQVLRERLFIGDDTRRAVRRADP